jgi:hypothetical protein
MTLTAPLVWAEANQRYLTVALAEVRGALERHIARARGETAPDAEAGRPLEEAAEAMSAAPALEALCATFGLSRFERATLILCAGLELDSCFVALCAAAQGDPSRAYPTFSLALAALPEPHWSALTPAAPLRNWRLIEVAAGSALTLSPLRIDERVLHYLAGVSHLDERLVGLVESIRPAGELFPSHRSLAGQISAAWSRHPGPSPPPLIQLCGPESAGKRAVTVAACASLGLNLSVLAARALPLAPAECEALIRLWEREAALSGSALLLDCDELEPTDPVRQRALARLVEACPAALVVSVRERRNLGPRPALTLTVGKPAVSEQRALWQHALGEAASHLNGQLEALLGQFSLSSQEIDAVREETLAQGEPNDTEGLGTRLWDACRARTRLRLDDLTQRIEPAARWGDLVLPEPQKLMLRDIAVHVRQRVRVYETWAFSSRSSRGLGISALFAGASGTGKTMAAEVLAHELRLDLYRIDLASVVSKYIGETEKNLRRVFDAAEEGGAVLLFDEADALFGKRGEVKDSHDRYANIEVSYLLQRMDAYRGLAILTTNMKDALDPAFLRRLRFLVQFPFPDTAQRAEIWRHVFPAATPTRGLDVAKLARLSVAGGNIRNIALYAAFLAAEADEPVTMAHLRRAASVEYAKLERPLTEAEIGGWL